MKIYFVLLFITLGGLAHSKEAHYISVKIENSQQDQSMISKYLVKKDSKNRSKVSFLKKVSGKEKLLGVFEAKEGVLQSVHVYSRNKKAIFITLWSAGARSEILRIFMEDQSFTTPLYERRSSSSIIFKEVKQKDQYQFEVDYTVIDDSALESKEVNKKESWTPPK